jgi:hypothetical protein
MSRAVPPAKPYLLARRNEQGDRYCEQYHCREPGPASALEALLHGLVTGPEKARGKSHNLDESRPTRLRPVPIDTELDGQSLVRGLGFSTSCGIAS